jgi:hypothetical protein
LNLTSTQIKESSGDLIMMVQGSHLGSQYEESISLNEREHFKHVCACATSAVEIKGEGDET